MQTVINWIAAHPVKAHALKQLVAGVVFWVCQATLYNNPPSQADIATYVALLMTLIGFDSPALTGRK